MGHQVLRVGERQGSLQVQEHDLESGDSSAQGQQLLEQVGGLKRAADLWSLGLRAVPPWSMFLYTVVLARSACCSGPHARRRVGALASDCRIRLPPMAGATESTWALSGPATT